MGDIDGLDLGTFGVWTFDFEFQPAAKVRASIQELEAQGWRSFWIPELFGREALTHAGYLLSCTEQLHVINGIAQIWPREAASSTTSSSGGNSRRSSPSSAPISKRAQTTSGCKSSGSNRANPRCRTGACSATRSWSTPDARSPPAKYRWKPGEATHGNVSRSANYVP
jgi:hypothetical protein